MPAAGALRRAALRGQEIAERALDSLQDHGGVVGDLQRAMAMEPRAVVAVRARRARVDAFERICRVGRRRESRRAIDATARERRRRRRDAV